MCLQNILEHDAFDLPAILRGDFILKLKPGEDAIVTFSDDFCRLPGLKVATQRGHGLRIWGYA
jgi:hypothetical protein